MSEKMIKTLFVEDDDVYGLLFKKTLSSGYEGPFHLTIIQTLHEAIERCAHEEFDVILLDLNLSDSMGLDTFTQMTYAAPNTPIVILTASDDLAIKALEYGVQDYLVKGQENIKILPRVIYFAIERRKSEEKIKTRTQELERLNKLMVSRELAMIELKKELETLTLKADKLKKYA
ncbi:MAG: response regulator [Candidatus Omnitrophica bacterium]|nr:response regulator [Candidatus Omnitrophota bacterium]